MNQLVLQYGLSPELELFPHIRNLTLIKNTTIKRDTFTTASSDGMTFYYIVDGKFEWLINGRDTVLYPGDAAIILPGQVVGGSQGFLGIGTVYKLQIQVDQIEAMGVVTLGNWSGLSENEARTVTRILIANGLPVVKSGETGRILAEIKEELQHQEIGYFTRVNHLLDHLFILLARQSIKQAGSQRDFPKSFATLEQRLRDTLEHQWTVEEMAALVGLGTTAFTEKVKVYTGFSPIAYLINLRISEAIRLLKRSDHSVTGIALETGFYSSQHFSTTFKKLTGYTPGEFRKLHLLNSETL
jgi:AraC-like DNA-binding protein